MIQKKNPFHSFIETRILVVTDSTTAFRDVTVPILYRGIGMAIAICIGRYWYWALLVLVGIGIGHYWYWSVLVLISIPFGISISISKNLRKRYFEKVMIFHKP